MSRKINFIGVDKCSISEITVAELRVGAEKSQNPILNHAAINSFLQTITILPITQAIDIFAKEKVRLERAGTPMHDHFDVLIAATALFYNLTLATNNVKDFSVYPTLDIEDWVLPTLPIGFA